jgi:hypothetical protein
MYNSWASIAINNDLIILFKLNAKMIVPVIFEIKPITLSMVGDIILKIGYKLKNNQLKHKNMCILK